MFVIGDTAAAKDLSIDIGNELKTMFNFREATTQIVTGSQEVSAGDVSFVVVGDADAKLVDYANSLPTSITFLVYVPDVAVQACNKQKVKHSLRTHRVVECVMTGDVRTYVCDENEYPSISDVVKAHTMNMFNGWKNVNSLQINMKKMSVYAAANNRQCETLSDSLMFPFSTRGKIKCNNMIIISKDHEKMKSSAFFERHPIAVGAGAVQFTVLPCTSAGTASLNNAVCRNRHAMVIIEIDFNGADSTSRSVHQHREHSESAGVDVFTIIRIASAADKANYTHAIDIALNNLNCIVISDRETTITHWRSHVFTAIGAVEINRHKDYYGAVDRTAFKQAIDTTQSILSDSDMTSGTFVAVLKSQ